MKMNLMGVGEVGAVPMINYHQKSGRLYPSTLPNRKHPMTRAWLRHPSHHVNSPHLQKDLYEYVYQNTAGIIAGLVLPSALGMLGQQVVTTLLES